MYNISANYALSTRNASYLLAVQAHKCCTCVIFAKNPEETEAYMEITNFTAYLSKDHNIKL